MPARPLRVTMVNKYYSPPHLGGVETVVRTLSEGLVEHAGARVRALVSNENRAPAFSTRPSERVRTTVSTPPKCGGE